MSSIPVRVSAAKNQIGLSIVVLYYYVGAPTHDPRGQYVTDLYYSARQQIRLRKAPGLLWSQYKDRLYTIIQSKPFLYFGARVVPGMIKSRVPRWEHKCKCKKKTQPEILN